MVAVVELFVVFVVRMCVGVGGGGTMLDTKEPQYVSAKSAAQMIFHSDCIKMKQSKGEHFSNVLLWSFLLGLFLFSP